MGMYPDSLPSIETRMLGKFVNCNYITRLSLDTEFILSFPSKTDIRAQMRAGSTILTVQISKYRESLFIASIFSRFPTFADSMALFTVSIVRSYTFPLTGKGVPSFPPGRSPVVKGERGDRRTFHLSSRTTLFIRVPIKSAVISPTAAH